MTLDMAMEHVYALRGRITELEQRLAALEESAKFCAPFENRLNTFSRNTTEAVEEIRQRLAAIEKKDEELYQYITEKPSMGQFQEQYDRISALQKTVERNILKPAAPASSEKRCETQITVNGKPRICLLTREDTWHQRGGSHYQHDFNGTSAPASSGSWKAREFRGWVENPLYERRPEAREAWMHWGVGGDGWCYGPDKLTCNGCRIGAPRSRVLEIERIAP